MSDAVPLDEEQLRRRVLTVAERAAVVRTHNVLAAEKAAGRWFPPRRVSEVVADCHGISAATVHRIIHDARENAGVLSEVDSSPGRPRSGAESSHILHEVRQFVRQQAAAGKPELYKLIKDHKQQQGLQGVPHCQ